MIYISERMVLSHICGGAIFVVFLANYYPFGIVTEEGLCYTDGKQLLLKATMIIGEEGKMKRLILVVIFILLLFFYKLANSIIVESNETNWYENLPTASTATELFGTHKFSTEGGANEVIIPTPDKTNASNSLQTTPSNTIVLEELISSDNIVSIPCNGRSEFVDIIAKINDTTYVNVTSIVTWESEDNEIAYAYDGRIMANNQGTTVITASLAGIDTSIDVIVEEYIDLDKEIERLNTP